MKDQLNFDVEVLTSEIMKELNIPISRKAKPSKKTINDISSSRLISNVKVEDLVIDLTYQRKPNVVKVSKIIRDFDPNALGVLICSMREDGTVAVIDGGHRIAALNAMGLGNSDVRCLVFFDLTLSQEAEMFTLLNDNRTKPKTNDIFKSKVVANDDDAVAINSILNKYGLRVGNAAGSNVIRAVGTLNKVYKNHGKYILDTTIYCLNQAFGSHSTSFNDQSLSALSEVIAHLGNSFDKDRAVKVLKSYGNANLWSNKGTIIAKQTGYRKMYIGMIFVFANDYNKRLKNNRIELKNMGLN